MKNSHLDLLASMRASAPGVSVPTARELTDHLNTRLDLVGEVALAEFAYLQMVAAGTWGAESTAHFARVLRDARTTPKAAPKTKWQKAEAMIDLLPTAWREAMRRQVDLSRQKSTVPGFVMWSADYSMAVTTALGRWARFAMERNLPLVPSGATLHRYGMWLMTDENLKKPVTLRTASDYISRVHAGLVVVDPGSTSLARNFVVRNLREAADLCGATTKTGAQLVGARALYNLGFQQMNEARSRKTRGLHAAKDFRNGILLAVAAALPQRARALSALDFEKTLKLLGGDAIHVRIPAEMLKLPEEQKDGEPFDVIFHNARLAEALSEYRHTFRPLFDDGSCLFPSMHSTRHAISEAQIGRLVGNITEKLLKIRIPIHRMRDNVATDASENLEGGRLASKVLLGHTDIATGDPYDHSDGMKARREFGGFIESRRSAPVDLALW